MILAVSGASGKLGSLICQVCQEGNIETRALSRPVLQDDLLWSEAIAGISVILDVSLPAGTEAIARRLRRQLPQGLKALVVGTTGHQPHQLAELEALSAHLPVILASNFSKGVYLFQEILEATTRSGLKVADLLKEMGFDLGIFESHHTRKKDAPSGTALTLAQAAGIAPDHIAALRVGHTIGEHSLFASSADEELRITHTAHHRRLFAAGAVELARRVGKVTREPGIYTIQDIYNEKRLH